MIPLNANLTTLQRSGIRRYTNLAKSVPDCVMLTLGEPDFDTPEEVKAAALLQELRSRNAALGALLRRILAFVHIPANGANPLSHVFVSF